MQLPCKLVLKHLINRLKKKCSNIHLLLLGALLTLGLLISCGRVKGMAGWSSCPNEGPWGGRRWGFRRCLRGKRGSRGTRKRDLPSKIR